MYYLDVKVKNAVEASKLIEYLKDIMFKFGTDLDNTATIDYNKACITIYPDGDFFLTESNDESNSNEITYDKAFTITGYNGDHFFFDDEKEPVDKFTEDQYQQILAIGDKSMGTGLEYVIGNPLFLYMDSINRADDLYTAALFLIPASQEWAHGEFVEEEPKYYWTSKTLDNQGAHYQLYRTRDDMLLNVYIPAKVDRYYEQTHDYAITESQVRKWGFNPEQLDRVPATK